jgi:hypothetical protein
MAERLIRAFLYRGALPPYLKVEYGPVGLLGRFFLWATPPQGNA